MRWSTMPSVAWISPASRLRACQRISLRAVCSKNAGLNTKVWHRPIYKLPVDGARMFSTPTFAGTGAGEAMRNSRPHGVVRAMTNGRGTGMIMAGNQEPAHDPLHPLRNFSRGLRRDGICGSHSQVTASRLRAVSAGQDTPRLVINLTLAEQEVRLHYVGHSTYVIETAGGLTAATDFTGFVGQRYYALILSQ